MAEPRALAMLSTWLSPAYPVGAFAYSHGLETAIADQRITDAATLEAWLEGLMRFGAPRADVVLMAAAYRDPEADDIATLAHALQPSSERRLESETQGRAFASTTAAAWSAPGLRGAPAPYPVAVGRAAAAHGLDLAEVSALFLTAVAANLASAAVRLVPLGQTDGQRVLAALSSIIAEEAAAAAAAPVSEAGGCALLSDIASMRHEALPVRIFRS